MLDEIKKSISATLYERTISPLFGSFFFSWVVWNWKIIIVLFFTNSSELEVTKFEFIDQNLLNIWAGLIYPILSTIFILTFYSWLSEQSYRLWLYFEKRKNEHKNRIENQKLLTIEQSMKLRLELARKEETFENLIRDKEELIQALKSENAKLLEIQKEKPKRTIEEQNLLDFENFEKKEIDKFFLNQEAVSYFEQIAKNVQHNWEFNDNNIPHSVTSYYIAHDLIERSNAPGRYKFTKKGKEYLKEYFNRKATTNKSS